MKKPEVTLHRRKIGNPYRYNRYPINFSTRVGTTVHSRLSNLSSNHLSPLFFFSISLNQDSVFHLILQHPSLYLSKDRAQVRRKVRTFFYFSRTLSRSFSKKKSIRLLHHRGTNKLVHLLCQCMDEKILRSSTLVENHRGKCNLVENFRDWEKRLSEF